MSPLLSAVLVLTSLGEPAQPIIARNVARVYIETDAAAVRAPAALPPNITLAGVYEPIVLEMLRSSPAFRRQCNRIGRNPSLQVTVLHWISPGTRSETAITRLRRGPGGRIDATVLVASLVDAVELIAHEFEHVLEQLDDVDLRAMASRARTGVRSIDPQEHFETERAIAAGRRVSGEVGGARR